MTSDWLGDLLREFYAKFGAAGEGPPPDLNICELGGIALEVPDHLETDVDILKRLCADTRLSVKIKDCDQLLEEIRRAPEGLLYKEIDECLDDMSIEPTAVYHGVMWYSQAAIADPRESVSARKLYERAVESGCSPLVALGRQVTGATILRLYVALVYLRGDWFRQGVGRTTLDAAPSLLRFAKLLNHDVVRHLRNALAHGHITPTCAGLLIKDRDFEVVLSPDILNKVSTGIWILHRAILTVYAKRDGIDDLPGAFKWPG
ncbi:MAG: hypothetical protein JNL50_00365 [Phycisphaerae bacterium]|nr:hypothetical protein [Phycisphaerae bacterium]